MARILTLFTLVLMLTGCTNGAIDLDKPPVPLGDFKLGHNVVVAPNIVKGPLSRDASDDEWIAAMKYAIDERFGRYDGESTYHLGISLEGYVLAAPGIPLVLSPKSALILLVTVWDDKAGGKLNQKAHQITVLEALSGETLLGSGLTQNAEEQMRNLSVNAAKQIESWMLQQSKEHGWFQP